ncbi:ATP-binding protein [Phenylobacterium sp. LjRoot225]|uniref:sensor histidine kinase n=1 Tax=Phenylobacterium sp. LjRoot225 TaxID=3342285 RepID=UPI003ECF09DB
MASIVADPPDPSPARERQVLWLALVLGAVLAAVAIWAIGAEVQASSLAALRRQAEASAALRVAVLRSELNKQRTLPLALAQDVELKAALRSRDPNALQALSQKLEMLGAEAEAADVYVLDVKGETLAASNWRLPTSFVGSNYAFRPYYKEAMQRGAAETFALGTVSRRPGFYIARRVQGPAGPLGVVVVKLEFNALEQEWRQAGDPAFVVDPNGVVLITSIPAWRFHTLGRLDEPTLGALRASRQFGDGARLEPLPLAPEGRLLLRTEDGGERVLDSRAEAPVAGWTLHLLTPVAPAERAAAAGRWIAALAAGLLAVLGALIWRRRRRAQVRAAEALANRMALEEAVRSRTEELTRANAQLTAEVLERERAEARLQALQSDLVQANKLASLGQIAAGVAHEINQPVAAIRAYSDNAALLLDRGREAEAKKNLAAIGELTERVGSITDELRAFSRRATGRLEPTSVAEAIEGSLLLTNSRVRRRQLRVVRPKIDPALRVMAERVRLEQVLVNLLQNAFEAVEGAALPEVRLAVDARETEIAITVSDNGPGLAPEVAESLFLPFVTTKPRGVGLGLVISRDIAAEFGGRLTVDSPPGEGAAFTVTLPRAP